MRDQQDNDRSFVYSLLDHETGDSKTFKSFLAAREHGQELAGSFDGWRQEQLATWYLLPARRYSVTVVTGDR